VTALENCENNHAVEHGHEAVVELQHWTLFDSERGKE
jgi:hypothetical protein